MPVKRYRYRSLADYLKQSGQKQADLAAALGIAQPMISRYAAGQERPRSGLALRIAQYCDFPVEAFDYAVEAYARRQQRTA